MAMNYSGMKSILNKMMYLDTVTVRRQQSVKVYGETKYKTVDVYKDIPCKLSQYGKALESHQEDRAFRLTTDLRVCCDPSYDIQPNDVLLVKHMGQALQFNAGKAFPYPTHQEIQAKKVGDG
jgi:hypothetical protein